MRLILLCCSAVLLIWGCNTSQTNDRTADSTTSAQTVKQLFDTTTSPYFHTIEIKAMQFVPDTLIVHQGDTVEWLNHDIVTHDITEEKNKSWSSSPLAAGKSWQMVINKSADYYCSIHVVMKGKIIVE